MNEIQKLRVNLDELARFLTDHNMTDEVTSISCEAQFTSYKYSVVKATLKRSDETSITIEIRGK